MEYKDALTKALTGRRAQKLTLKSMLGNAKENVTEAKTWRAMAAELGVSESTLRRARNGKNVSSETQNKLDQFAKREDVRRAQMGRTSRTKLDKFAQHGGKVKLKATQGPVGKGKQDYRRTRTVECFLPAEVFQEIQDAYLRGDDTAAADALREGIADYGWPDWQPPGGWEIGDTDRLTFQ